MKLLYDMLSLQAGKKDSTLVRNGLDFVQALQHELEACGDELEVLAYHSDKARLASLRQSLPQAAWRYCYLPGLGTARQDLLRPGWAPLLHDAYRLTQADVLFMGAPLEQAECQEDWTEDWDSLGGLTVAFLHLIPSWFEKIEQLSPHDEKIYRQALNRLRSCGFVLASSEEVRQNAVDELHIRPERIAVIGSAARHCLQQSVTHREKKLAAHGIKKEFVLHVDSSDRQDDAIAVLECWAALPLAVRGQHQLLIVGQFDEQGQRWLRSMALSLGIRTGEVLVEGWLPESEMHVLYALAKLCVCPLMSGSSGEVLDAFESGVPVIAGDTGWSRQNMTPEAICDAGNSESFAALIERCLSDNGYLNNIRQQSRSKVENSWQALAKRTIAAIKERIAINDDHSGMVQAKAQAETSVKRIAWVVAAQYGSEECAFPDDYTAALVPELSRNCLVDVYTNIQPDVEELASFGGGVFSWQDLPERVADYDCLVYVLGNSEEETFIRRMLECFPGLVVVSNVGAANDFYGKAVRGFPVCQEDVLASQGWHGLARVVGLGADRAINHCPVGKDVLDLALGVVFLREDDMEKCRATYGSEYMESLSCEVIPVFSNMGNVQEQGEYGCRTVADDWLPMLTECVVAGWRQHQSKVKLADTVGEALFGSACQPEECLQIAKVHEEGRLAQGFRRVYAWLTEQQFMELAEWEPQSLWADPFFELVPCRFEEAANRFVVDLQTADGSQSHPVHFSGRDVLLLAPFTGVAKAILAAAKTCPAVYACCEGAEYWSIQEAARKEVAGFVLPSRIRDFWQMDWAKMPVLPGTGRLLVDTTHVSHIKDSYGGIVHLCRNIAMEFLRSGRELHLIQFVQGRPVTNHAYEAELLGEIPAVPQQEEAVEYREGDRLFLLDPSWVYFEQIKSSIDALLSAGGQASTVVHDLLSLQYPEFFDLPPEGDQNFRRWVEFMLDKCGAFLCDSRHTAEVVKQYVQHQHFSLWSPTKLYYFPLGFDTAGAESKARAFLRMFLDEEDPVFLMVGSIEPRKGHSVAVKAFQRLWKQGVKAKLLIVGHDGWKNKEVVELMESCPQYGHDLLLVRDAEDEEVAYCYEHASCLIAASRDEGFGLPLVEAAARKLPIICSDIPIFHEVTQEQADFFTVFDEEALYETLVKWMEAENHPDSGKIRLYSWKECAESVLEILDGKVEAYDVAE